VITAAGGQMGARRPSFISTPRSDASVLVEEFAVLEDAAGKPLDE
jgi:hypothetical protein